MVEGFHALPPRVERTAIIKEAEWVVTCYVNNKASSLTSDNAELQEAFAWAVGHTVNFILELRRNFCPTP